MVGYIQICGDYMGTIDKRTVLLVGSGLISVSVAGYKLHEHFKITRYREECCKVRKARDDRVNKLQDKLAKLHLDKKQVEYITQLPLTELVRKTRSRELAAVDVLHAYQSVALSAHREINCLTNVIEEADEWAKRLDDTAKDREPTGLLYGVPISVKDNIPTKGQINSRGCVVYRNAVAKDDALLIKALKAEGAIPFVKTNIPQLMMGTETGNALYGVTTNSRDTSRTPGGSSGGEGSLIASGASVLGIGSDIGGSIRMPGSFCGICGLKSTSSRLSLRGIVPFGQTIVRSCWGPMARDVDSLTLAMKAALSPVMFNGDKTVPPMPFDDAVYSDRNPLTIGYYTDDGIYPAFPAGTRAVLLVKDILESRGHKLVPWSPPDIEYAYEGVYRSLSGNEGCVYKGFLGTGEILDPSIYSLMFACFMPKIERYLKVKLAEFRGERAVPLRLRGCRGVSSVAEWFTWTTASKLYIEKFEKHWNDQGIDAILCPSTLHAAVKVGFTKSNTMYAGYTGLYNFMDYAAGVVPVTKVTAEDVKALDQYPVIDSITSAACMDQKGTEGLPISVQCVAPMWREELCLRVMKEIEEGIK